SRYRDAFRNAAVVHEPKAARAGAGFKQPEECWNTSPPPSSAARSAMKFAGNRVFCRSKLLELPSPEIRFAPARRHASASLSRGTSRRMIDARTGCSARTLLIFERVSESKQRERLKQNKDH